MFSFFYTTQCSDTCLEGVILPLLCWNSQVQFWVMEIMDCDPGRATWGANGTGLIAYWTVPTYESKDAPTRNSRFGERLRKPSAKTILWERMATCGRLPGYMNLMIILWTCINYWFCSLIWACVLLLFYWHIIIEFVSCKPLINNLRSDSWLEFPLSWPYYPTLK